MRHVLDQIDQWSCFPDQPVHIYNQRVLTWGELLRRSKNLAAALLEALPGNRDPIVVMGHKQAEMLIAFLGCIRAGHPYVPVDSSLPVQRVERILAVSQAKLVLTPENVATMSDGPAREPAPVAMAPDDPYYIMFTSGSTGDPKGVVLTLGCLETFLEWSMGEHRLRRDAADPAPPEVFLNQAPYSFDVSIMDSYGALCSGGTVVCVGREHVANPRQLYQLLGASGATFWVSTPSFAQMCLVEKTFGPRMLPNLRRFWFCGEVLSPDIASALLDRFPSAEVWNTYGPTEATVAVTSVQVTRELLARENPLPIGYAMPGVDVYCGGPDGQEVADGERGEIIINGPNVSPGYLGRPDLTAKAFFTRNGHRAYRTGDWGRRRNRLLFFEGRADSQVKMFGYRIELGDIESNLRALPLVRDAVVLPVVKEGAVEAIAAFVIITEGAFPAETTDAMKIAKVKEQLAAVVPAYMVPRKVILMPNFPMTANGKADRKELSKLLG